MNCPKNAKHGAMDHLGTSDIAGQRTSYHECPVCGHYERVEVEPEGVQMALTFDERN